MGTRYLLMKKILIFMIFDIFYNRTGLGFELVKPI